MNNFRYLDIQKVKGVIYNALQINLPERAYPITAENVAASLASSIAWVEPPIPDHIVSLLADLEDGDPCSFDHHGGCQAHGYLSLGPGERCPQGLLTELLAGFAVGES